MLINNNQQGKRDQVAPNPEKTQKTPNHGQDQTKHLPAI